MKIKKLIFVSIVSAGLILSGCSEDFITKTDPNKQVLEDFYKTPEDAELAITAAYSALQMFGVYNRYWGYHTSARSDESDFTSFVSGLPEVTGLDNFSMSADLVAVQEVWGGNYKGVLKANMVIANVPGIQFADENQKNRILGEAYFLRGLYHFILVKNFGEEIPMFPSVPETNEEFFPSPAKPGAIYDLIISDFIMAKSLLPLVDTYRGTADLGRVSKGAATTYLGQAYLFTEQYQLAANELAEVVANQVGSYALMDDFRDNFDERFENNNESIFEVQYMLTPGKGVWNIYGENDDASEAQIITQGQTMVRDVGGAWWNMAPSQAMADEFESSDPRYYQTFWCSGGDTYFTNNRDETYEDFVPAAYDGMVFWRKWCHDYETDQESEINIRVMRLSDAYLMLAECLIEGASISGQTPEALINAVRTRARQTPNAATRYPNLTGDLPTVEELIAAAPVINGRTINNITAALRHERMVELAFEGKRWFDIVRWGIGVEVCGSHFKPLLPIYQGDLDTNPNLKPNSSN